METGSAYLIFDGECNFCNYWVNFAINHKKNKNLIPVARQQFIQQFPEKLSNQQQHALIESVGMLNNNNFYLGVDVIFFILKDLKWNYRIFYVLKFVPKPILNWLYSKVAKYRYLFFGKRNSCPIHVVNH